MRRIAKDRCGYNGYTCIGTEPLKDAIKLNRMVYDDDINRSTFEDSYTGGTPPNTYKYHIIDNYLSLPVKFGGFLPEVDILQDMSIQWSSNDECYLDASLDSGRFFDLMSHFGNKVVARASGESAYVTLADHLLCMSPDYAPGADAQELALLPATLEPVPVGAFPPVTVEIMPDPIENGIAIAIGNIFKWRCALEDFLGIYEPVMPDACALPNLLAAMNSETKCPNFTISLVWGTPIVHGADGQLGECRYRVSSGIVTLVDGTEVEIEEELFSATPEKNGFYVYANLDKDSSTGEWTGQLSETRGPISLGIGGARIVKSSAFNGVCEEGADAGYKMYVIEQDECLSPVNPVTPVDITTKIGHLEDLLAKLGSESVCDDFRFELLDGDPLSPKPDDSDDTPWLLGSCRYRIRSGLFVFNGSGLSVPDVEFVADEPRNYYWYLELVEHARTPGKCSASGCSNSVTYTARLTQEFNQNSICLGGVRYVETEQYKMYVVDQQNCGITEDMMRFPSGGLVWYTPGTLSPSDEAAGALSIGGGCSMEQLLTSMNEETACPVFNITHISGTTFVYGDGAMPVCRYRVSAGYVRVNGAAVHFDSAEFVAPFYAYLNLTVTEASTTAQLSTTRGTCSIGIGGVYLVDTTQASTKICSDSASKDTRYRMYVIEQDECVVDVDLIRTDEDGFLFRTGGTGSAQPYKAYPYSDCDV